MKIVCLEPHLGNSLRECDVGFGDRVAYWTLSYILSTFVEDCQIIVQHYYWPELLFLDFPKTTTKKLSKFEKTKLLPISFEQYKSIIKQKDISSLDKDGIYYLNFFNDVGFKLVDEFFGISTWLDYYSRAVSQVKIKHVGVKEFFQKNFSGVSWIHMRRGHQTFASEKFFHEVDKYMDKTKIESYWKTYSVNFQNKKLGSYFDNKDKYLEQVRDKSNIVETSGLSITSDETYFRIIDNILLKENKDAKIYISSDIPIEFYSYYYDRYENNLIDKRIYLKSFLELYKNTYFIKKRERLKFSISLYQVIYNIFDLLVGINADNLIIRDSQWSSFVSSFKPKKILILREDQIFHTNFEQWRCHLSKNCDNV